MQLKLKAFSQVVSDAAAAVQSSANALLNLYPGSTLRAILEANAAVAMWIQSLIYNVLLTTRLATSGSTDADSFGADFGFYRLPAATSGGTVTFGRFSSSTTSAILPGTNLSTIDNSLTFTVVIDPLNPNWDAAQNAYILPISTAEIDVPVVCTVAGSLGNVGVGVIGNISSTVVGVDTVINAAAFVNGADAESDAAFRVRFVSYILSLSRATLASIGYAIIKVQQGLTYTIIENENTDGTYLPGNLVITVDDGSHEPSSDLINLVGLSIEEYRSAGVSYDILPPVIVDTVVDVVATPLAGYNVNDLITPVSNAVSAYANSLRVGEPLYYSRLVQAAYNATEGIDNVIILIDWLTNDLIVSPRQVIRASLVWD